MILTICGLIFFVYIYFRLFFIIYLFVNLNQVNLIQIIIKMIIYRVCKKYIFNIQCIGILYFLRNDVPACRAMLCIGVGITLFTWHDRPDIDIFFNIYNVCLFLYHKGLGEPLAIEQGPITLLAPRCGSMTLVDPSALKPLTNPIRWEARVSQPLPISAKGSKGYYALTMGRTDLGDCSWCPC